MCHFLSISVPRESVPEVPTEFSRKIHFTEHTNRSITELTPSDWTSFTATSGGCSCGFHQTALDNTPKDQSKLKKKYQKKGWSDAKIKRALEKQKNASMQQEGLRDDISDLVANLATNFLKIRLSLHWYSGCIETENFSLNDIGKVSLKEFRKDLTILKEESTLTIESTS